MYFTLLSIYTLCTYTHLFMICIVSLFTSATFYNIIVMLEWHQPPPNDINIMPM